MQLKKKPDNKTKIEEKVRNSLKYSVIDGAFYSAMVSFGESFFSAFAVFLNAATIHLGLLGSLPLALGSLLQLFSDKLIAFINSRKRLILISASFEGLMYIAIALVFFLGEFRLWYFILFVSLYKIFGMVVSPAWNSWMGDLVNPKERGTYFGKRSRVTGMTSFVSYIIAGNILQAFSGTVKNQYIGFVIIFAVALISRIISLIYLTKKYDPKYRKPTKKEHFTFFQFIKHARFRNYGLFVFYLCFINLSAFLSAPFFSAYMLYDLKFSYLQFTILNGAFLLTKFISLPIWGKVIDNYGTKKILTLAGFLMPICPMLWLVSHSPIYLVFVQMFAGFAWGGFELSSFNFIFDTTKPKKRATCVAYYNVLNGIAIISGSLIGTFIVNHNNIFWSKYLLVFLLSGLLRYIASFTFLPKLKEVREVEHIPYHKLLFNIVTTIPTEGLVHTITTFRNKKKDY